MPRHPLAARIVHWPPEVREAWTERAAIIEYQANVPRAEAEQRAEAIVRANWNRERTPP